MSSSFRLPRLSTEDWTHAACNIPTVTCTLGDLEAAVAREALKVYEFSYPTGLWPGKRWLTRAPRCWEAIWPQSPLFLIEVRNESFVSLWFWRLEIEGEALVQAWLSAIGESRAAQLVNLVKAGHYRQIAAKVREEGADL